MNFNPESYLVIDCPHEFQRYVGCNDETAKELAGLVYEYAMDYALRDSIRKGAPRFTKSDAFISLTTTLTCYDVFPRLFFEGIVLRRYERPPIGNEARDPVAFIKYLYDTKYDAVNVPINIPDIIRAFGEFGGKEVDQGIIDGCFGFYDDPARNCPVCGKNWKRTWDR